MADDMFTAEMEWLLRWRRERLRIGRIVRLSARFVRENASSQAERDIRRWKSKEAELLYEDLRQLDEFMGDYSMGQNRGLV